MSAAPRRVLLTNDDGYEAKGLDEIRHELLEAGMVVTVLAPDGQRSGQARRVSCHDPVSVRRVGGTDQNPIYACSGSPVDCVRVGVFAGRFPPADIVVSGINHGVNLGDDATFSGTLGAAIEGALLGRPAIAFSQQDLARDLSMLSSAPHRFELAWLAPPLIEALLASPVPRRAVVNVNFPNTLRGTEIGVTRLGEFSYEERWMRPAADLDDGWTFWPYLHADDPHPALDDAADSDTGCILGGRISVTPLSFAWAESIDGSALRRWAATVAAAGEAALANGPGS
jgi:5'-nucleotidase